MVIIAVILDSFLSFSVHLRKEILCHTVTKVNREYFMESAGVR